MKRFCAPTFYQTATRARRNSYTVCLAYLVGSRTLHASFVWFCADRDSFSRRNFRVVCVDDAYQKERVCLLSPVRHSCFRRNSCVVCLAYLVGCRVLPSRFVWLCPVELVSPNSDYQKAFPSLIPNAASAAASCLTKRAHSKTHFCFDAIWFDMQACIASFAMVAGTQYV